MKLKKNYSIPKETLPVPPHRKTSEIPLVNIMTMKVVSAYLNLFL
jgi:hypothetical protein